MEVPDVDVDAAMVCLPAWIVGGVPSAMGLAIAALYYRMNRIVDENLARLQAADDEARRQQLEERRNARRAR